MARQSNISPVDLEKRGYADSISPTLDEKVNMSLTD